MRPLVVRFSRLGATRSFHVSAVAPTNRVGVCMTPTFVPSQRGFSSLPEPPAATPEPMAEAFLSSEEPLVSSEEVTASVEEEVNGTWIQLPAAPNAHHAPRPRQVGTLFLYTSIHPFINCVCVGFQVKRDAYNRSYGALLDHDFYQGMMLSSVC